MSKHNHSPKQKHTHRQDLSGLPDPTSLPAPTELPEGWKMRKIGDVANIRAGVAFPPRFQGSATGRYPFFKVSDMNLPGNEPRMKLANNWVDDATVSALNAKPFPPDTIVFPKVGGAVYTNKKRMLACAALVDNNVMGISVTDNQCYAEYLFYWLMSIDIRGFSNPGPLPSINAHRVKNALFPLPPLPEQRAIARVLSTIQRAIETQDKLIAAARALKRALMRHLFTYGVVPPAQAERVLLKETEVGLVPEGWEVMKLGDLAEVKYGKANPKSSGNVPIVGSGGIFAWTDKPLIEYPTIIVGRKGTAGEIHLADKPSYPSDTTFYLVWKKQVSIYFLFEYLCLHKPSGEHAKTTLPSLQRHVLENLVVTLPPESEQRAIARILSAVDRKIAAEEKRKAALQTLFKTMLHKLMTGQIRVK